MRTWKTIVGLIAAALMIGAVRLIALADGTQRGANKDHPIMAAQQGGSDNRSTQTEEARLWRTMAAGRAGRPVIRLVSDDDDHPIDKWLASAMAKESTTAGMRRVTMEAYHKWDDEMNRVYRKLMKRLNREQHAALLKAQKAWLQFRDAEGDAISKIYVIPQGGTMFLPMATSAGMERIRQRALELEEFDSIMDEHEDK